MTDRPEAFPSITKPDVNANVVAAERLFFDGSTVDSPLADWARLRGQDFGETIVPRQLHIVGKNGKPHTVAWLHRSGMDLNTGEPYDYHHLACDCMPQAEIEGSMAGMFACESLSTALLGRAQTIRAEFGLPDILPADPTARMWTGGKQIVVSTMLYILERDRLHPESWMANYMSGRHELSLLSLVLNREVAELAMYAEILQEAGKVEVNNATTVMLAAA